MTTQPNATVKPCTHRIPPGYILNAQSLFDAVLPIEERRYFHSLVWERMDGKAINHQQAIIVRRMFLKASHRLRIAASSDAMREELLVNSMNWLTGGSRKEKVVF